jgi:hypothetical protein
MDANSTLPTEDVLLKQRELLLLREKLKLIKEHGLDFYRPHEKQHLFHKSSAKRRAFFAGNRTGKSEADAAETVAWAVGERSWYKYRFPVYGIRDGKKVIVEWHEGHANHPLVHQGIPTYATKQLVITTDWKKVDEIWTSPRGDNPGKLWKFIPKTLDVQVKRNHEGIIDQLFFSNGAVIRFTTEQAFVKNPQSSESSDYDRVAIDEPVVEDMWKANARSLVDRDGQGDFTLTSLRERWIYDYFTDPENVREDRFHVRATIYDNPYLTPEAIARFADELTADERECRLLGIPLELSGLVYKEFIREVHLLKDLPLGWTSWTNPPLNWTIYVAIDVHEQTPQAALFVAVPPIGAPIIYDEIWRKCVADELAEEIVRRLDGRTVGFVKADPRAWLEDPVNRASMAQRFFAHGLYVEKASKALGFGINNMRSVLKQRIPTPDGTLRPAVYFAPSVKQTLWEISRYHYDKENHPVDKDDHFMECMYRLFISPLVWIDAKTSPSVPDFDIPMTSRALREFAEDASRFDVAVRN